MTNPNLPELKRLNMWVQEQDKLEPGERRWEQGFWVTLREEEPACKTAFCVAGAAVVRAGHKLILKDDGCGDQDMWLNDHWAGTSEITHLANEILGIDAHAVEDVYDENNSAEDIDRYIRQIFAIAGTDYEATEPAPDKDITVRDIA
jgi:hypothetical protein